MLILAGLFSVVGWSMVFHVWFTRFRKGYYAPAPRDMIGYRGVINAIPQNLWGLISGVLILVSIGLVFLGWSLS